MIITLFALSLAAIALATPRGAGPPGVVGGGTATSGPPGGGTATTQTLDNPNSQPGGNLSNQTGNLSNQTNDTKMNCSIIGMLCNESMTCSNGMVCGVGTDCKNNACVPVDCFAKNSACCEESEEPGCDEATNSGVAFCVGQMLPSCTAESGSWTPLCVELAQDYCYLICNKKTAPPTLPTPPTNSPTSSQPTTSPTPFTCKNDDAWRSSFNLGCGAYEKTDAKCNMGKDGNGVDIIQFGNECNYCHCVYDALDDKQDADTSPGGKTASEACPLACDMCTAAACVDDDLYFDKRGNVCSEYLDYPDECGDDDTFDFKAFEQCCACKKHDADRTKCTRLGGTSRINRND